MLKLVSDNPFPRPDLHDSISEHWQEQDEYGLIVVARHEAEWHQREQSEAHDYGFLVVFGATCFLFGTLFASAVIVLAKLL